MVSIGGLYVRYSAPAPGTTVFTLRVEQTDTAVSCTVPIAATTCTNATAVTVPAGSTIVTKAQSAGFPGGIRGGTYISYVSTATG
jgi:hypothetical protein